jgi:hypothetical protein
VTQIRCIYDVEPNFPATDQHPDAVRYFAGGKWVDAIGGEPTQTEIDTILGTGVTGQRIAIKAQLADIDRQTIAAARGLREFILAQAQVTDYTAEGGPLPISNFQKFADNQGIQRIAAAEAQAALLRAQLAAL